ncbi:hypothetical protein [Arthrobacter sp. GMC3]|uniref:hypothetical protein n=1 Tax=Arthrobacter sp. GMC3 TaxID=2058894 RepID=UPI000CE3218E|nr:hypothetical protein [Arthrobacter sp. GMC3]
MSATATPADASFQRWESTLEQMRLDAQSAVEQATNRTSVEEIDGGYQAWTPPADLGVLPDELADRAAALLALQERAARLIAESRNAVEREIQALTVTRTPVRSVYVDVTG